MNTISRSELVRVGVADTRVFDMHDACYKLHTAYALMDKQNRAIIREEFPEIFAIVQAVGRGCEFLDSFDSEL
jgi:hypothetical protein